eukprot:GHVS01053075.1.p2 GENE.GHVS01053075.1~~GHVS01053075.1.p2  ORF type:complete len:133 (+),score=12.63 GHVS01053075.1:589-987(+)
MEWYRMQASTIKAAVPARIRRILFLWVPLGSSVVDTVGVGIEFTGGKNIETNKKTNPATKLEVRSNVRSCLWDPFTKVAVGWTSPKLLSSDLFEDIFKGSKEQADGRTWELTSRTDSNRARSFMSENLILTQ